MMLKQQALVKGKRSAPRTMRMSTLLLLFFQLLLVADAFYVSYEKPQDYEAGDSVPLLANKLTSPTSLSAWDFNQLPPCGGGGDSSFPLVPDTDTNGAKTGFWQRAIAALHGDAVRSVSSSSQTSSAAAYELVLGQDVSCRQLCMIDLSSPPQLEKWQQAIDLGMEYHWIVDGMPVAYRYENQARVALRYWGGIPVGQTGYYTSKDGNDIYKRDERFNNTSPETFYINNHLNFEIQYWKTSDNKYRVVRCVLQPFSIRYNLDASISAATGNILPVYLENPIQSCSSSSNNLHTTYTMIQATPPQPLEAGKVLVTYDVKWVPYTEQSSDGRKDPYKSRWDVFLQMDEGIPQAVHIFGLVLAIIVNLLVYCALLIWLFRDLSYKPLMMDSEFQDDSQIKEALLWPLSSLVFMSPSSNPAILCVLCGAGAHLLMAGFFFLVMFRSGIINESIGASVLTPAALFYIVFSPLGGYVTARMYYIFQGSDDNESSPNDIDTTAISTGINNNNDSPHTTINKEKLIRALQWCFVTAGFFPLLGLIVSSLVYGPLQSPLAPQYQIVLKSLPLILSWICLCFPLTILGGYFGFRHGPLANFPVIGGGSTGYQDLSLMIVAVDHDLSVGENSKSVSKWWTIRRVICLVLLAGFLPVIASFVEYAYGVAGPVYVGYFSDSSAFAIVSFILFILCNAGVSMLMYYKELRNHNYAWWWSSFWAGGSSGLYIFLLSLTWMASEGRAVSARTFFAYFLWFFYCSLGCTLMTGFVGVASCALFNRGLYSFLMKRKHAFEDERESLMAMQPSPAKTEPIGSSASAASSAESCSSPASLGAVQLVPAQLHAARSARAEPQVQRNKSNRSSRARTTNDPFREEDGRVVKNLEEQYEDHATF